MEILTETEKYEKKVISERWSKEAQEKANAQPRRGVRVSDCQVKAIPVYCRSVWCLRCSKSSPTNASIREKLATFDYKRVRHVVLTVNRTFDANKAWDKIRNEKAIYKLLETLDLLTSKYLWVLEFHADGYPHWHLLIEKKEKGMIGNDKIADAWLYGLTWESYIKDEAHWKNISGYHEKTGYIAGESKKHQLTLPKYLKDLSNIRKFGTNAYCRDKSKQLLQQAEQPPFLKKTRSPNKTYYEKDNFCSSQSFVEIAARGRNLKMTIDIEVEAIQDHLRSMNALRETASTWHIKESDALPLHETLETAKLTKMILPF